MVKSPTTEVRTYALDTNVLIHDPNAVFKFEEHSVVIPMVVLEELDKLKVGASSVAADARQAVRTIDELLGPATPQEIMQGVPIKRPDGSELGEIAILMPANEDHSALSPHNNDNLIINDLLVLKGRSNNSDVVLVTKDINMRLKARGTGLSAEDYHNDQLITDLESLATGYHHVEGSFWDSIEAVEPQKVAGGKFHVMKKSTVQAVVERTIYVNQFIYDDKEFVGRIYKEDEEGNIALELLNTGILMRQKAWGLVPRDLFQAMSMYLLFDPEIDLVALNGAAGSGKTIMALACALEQTMESKDYKRIIATRSTRGLDEDIGFLPGTEAEKMQPWLGAFTDNLEALHAEDFDPSSSEDYVGARVPLQFKSLNFVRGRSFQQTFLIVDEAQNLTPHQVKTIVTRAGEGTKVVCLGNLAQIDTPYLGATSSGLTYMSERFKGFQHGGAITLQGVARSRLAAYAETHL